MTTQGKSATGCDTSNVSDGLAEVEETSSSADEAPLSSKHAKHGRLHELLLARQEEVLIRACAKAAARYSLLQTRRNFDAGIALFAEQLADALASDTFHPRLLRQTAARQGRRSLRMGFAISQLVYCYGDVYQAVLELASALDVSVAAEEFLILGHCLDEARASAVAAYEEKRAEALSRQQARELQRLCAELQRSLDSAFLALRGLKRNAGGLHGQAGALLDQSLSRLQGLVGGSLFRVRSQAAEAEIRANA